jgi:hypothetical protein
VAPAIPLGSVNQHGQVQAVGGVNEKIEGFFDVCRESGLTRDQGVLIPRSNVKNVLLRADMVDAVASGGFCVLSVDTVDDAIERLTGLSAADLNQRVEARPAAHALISRSIVIRTRGDSRLPAALTEARRLSIASARPPGAPAASSAWCLAQNRMGAAPFRRRASHRTEMAFGPRRESLV